MPANTPTPSKPSLFSLRTWLADGRAYFDLWTAFGLAGPGLMLCLVGAGVIRQWFQGHIDTVGFSAFAQDPMARAVGLTSLPSPLALGLCVLGSGILLMSGAWRLVRARAEVLRLRGA